MNKVELLGRLTRNPEMKNVGGSGDTPMARYTLAEHRRYRAAGADADFIAVDDELNITAVVIAGELQ